MKTILTVLFSVAIMLVQAQTTYAPNTGDNEFDASLNEINKQAKQDLDGFKSKLSEKYKLTKTKVDQMLKVMEPSDAYMACEVAQVAKKPVEQVEESYKQNKDKGWGVIAKEMGIKPGSKEFHALKGKAKEKGEKGKGSAKGKGEKNEKGKGKGKGKGKKEEHKGEKEDHKGEKEKHVKGEKGEKGEKGKKEEEEDDDDAKTKGSEKTKGKKTK